MRPAGAVARALSVPRPGLTMVSLHSLGHIGQGTDASTAHPESQSSGRAPNGHRFAPPASGPSRPLHNLPRPLSVKDASHSVWAASPRRATTRSSVRGPSCHSAGGSAQPPLPPTPLTPIAVPHTDPRPSPARRHLSEASLPERSLIQTS